MLSADPSIVCTVGRLDVGMLTLAVGLGLSEGVDEVTSSAEAVVMDPTVAGTELESTVDACAARVVPVFDVWDAAVEPPLVDVEVEPFSFVEAVTVVDDVECVEVPAEVEKLLASIGILPLEDIAVKPPAVDSWVPVPVVAMELLHCVDIVDFTCIVDVAVSELIVPIVEDIASVDGTAADAVIDGGEMLVEITCASVITAVDGSLALVLIVGGIVVIVSSAADDAVDGKYASTEAVISLFAEVFTGLVGSTVVVTWSVVDVPVLLDVVATDVVFDAISDNEVSVEA